MALFKVHVESTLCHFFNAKNAKHAKVNWFFFANFAFFAVQSSGSFPGFEKAMTGSTISMD
jgi:hypothetical protein